VSILHGAPTPDAATEPDAAHTPPDAEAMAVGHSRFTQGLDEPEPPGSFYRVERLRGLLLARNRDGALVTPLAARGPVERHSRPSYPGSTSRVLAGIDDAVSADAAWADNKRLRRERDEARAEAVREESLRQDAQARLVTAEARADAAEAELEKARGRIAELVLTLRAVGGAIHHAERHAKAAVVVAEPVDAHGEGGENDG
jgi:hypothetical protein